jgi:predicted amino acid racemase
MEGLILEGLGIYFPYRSEGSFHMPAQQRLVALAREIEGDYGFKLPVISGGSTNVFHSLIFEGKNVKGVNQLRIGTAILLGISSSIGPVLIKDFHHDTFVLDAELIEVKQRDRLYGILSIGRMDTEPEYLFPISPGVAAIDASSDHLIVDFTDSAETYRVGDRIAFQLGYFALSRLTASPYVRIEYR